MKKTLFSIGFIIALVLSINAYTGKVYQPLAGQKAPELTINGAHNAEVRLSDYRGRYVLLNFWASSDPESRIVSARYSRIISGLDEEQLSMISVNFDRSELLFREIVRIDNLDYETQHYVDGSQARNIIRDYELADGFKSFLIDPKGRIIAVNPDTRILNELLGIS